MGPPEKQPEFPVYDAFLYEGMASATYKVPYACNWIQVLDAILDPTHTTYLHSKNSHPQFSEGMRIDGVLKFFERNENHFLGSSTRRIGDNAWVRVNELILPNFTQAGSAYAADGTRQIYFGRSCFTRWVVPEDDQYNTKDGHEMIEQGEILDRPAEEKKCFPADSEAVEGMGAISTHKGENLMPTDRGISLYRRRVRKQVRDLAEGIEPPQPLCEGENSVRTYGQDTVLTMPPKEGADDRAYLDEIGTVVMELEFELEQLPDATRDAEIIKCLKAIEADIIA